MANFEMIGAYLGFLGFLVSIMGLALTHSINVAQKRQNKISTLAQHIMMNQQLRMNELESFRYWMKHADEVEALMMNSIGLPQIPMLGVEVEKSKEEARLHAVEAERLKDLINKYTIQMNALIKIDQNL